MLKPTLLQCKQSKTEQFDKVVYFIVCLKVFEFADKHRGSYSFGLKKYVCPFYCSYSGYQVNLAKAKTFHLYEKKKRF